jgi:hypothetical protein
MTVNPDKTAQFVINVRIPGWARNEAVPGDLYRFQDKINEPATIKINGKPAPLKLEKGYASLNRNWKTGDVIELALPTPVRRIVANDQVEADRGRVALQRGPLVYCAEWPDNPGGRVRNLMLPDSATLTAEFKPDLLNGVTVIKSRALALTSNADGKAIKTEQDFTAIPYYAWANRGSGEMIVWLPNNESGVKPTPPPTIASKSKARASENQNPNLIAAINDQSEPQSSSDNSDIYFHWWPKKGVSEWVEYAFEKPSTVSEIEIYWYDDTGRGECRTPASWRLLYKDGETWKPVETAEAYGVEKDRFNKLSFKPVMTAGLRIEVTMRQNWSTGIQEWKVK